jgi:uncharacterized membrane protein
MKLMWGCMVFAVVAIVLVISGVGAGALFIIWLARDLRTRPHRHHITSGATASEILDRRLASGEINPEQYRQLHTTLATKPGDPPSGTGSTAGAGT